MTSNASRPEAHVSTSNNRIGRRLGAAGWGLFLIWAGVSIQMDLGWGVGLIGTAAIILLAQVARRFRDLRFETVWVAAGVLFLLIGLWELYQIPLDLGPVLLIVAGGAVLFSLFSRSGLADGRRPSGRRCGWCRPRHARRTFVAEVDHRGGGPEHGRAT